MKIAYISTQVTQRIVQLWPISVHKHYLWIISFLFQFLTPEIMMHGVYNMFISK